MKRNIIYLLIFLFAIFLFPLFVVISIIIKNSRESDSDLADDLAGEDQDDLNTEFKGQVEGLTSRQAEILEYIISSENLTMADISLKFSSVTQRTLRRDLAAIEEKKLVKKHGKTKGATYSAVL